MLSEAMLAENLDYHSIWVSDHLMGMYDSPGDPRFECWTTTSAPALATSRIRLGQRKRR